MEPSVGLTDTAGSSKLAVAMAYAALFHAEAERALDGKFNNAEQTRLQLMAALEQLEAND